jgi:hypothetical protein
MDLRANAFTSLPESLADLPSLQKLDLRWTSMAETPAWLPRLEARGCVVLR